MSLPSHDRMNSVSAVHIWMPWRWQCSGWGLLIIMLHLDLDYEQQTLRSSGPVASFNHSDQPDRPREEENRNKKSCLSSMDGLRILADVCSRGMEIGWMGLRLAKQRPVSNRNITDQDCFPGRQRGDDRWILCFKSLMLGAQTQSKRMDSVCLLSNFSCKDASHIVIIITLLFTITLIPKNKQKTIILKQGVFSVHLSFWKRMQHECIVKQIMHRLHISILF